MSNPQAPSVRISICANPEQIQPDIYVVGGTVQAALPVDLNPILEPLVRFYADVPIRVKCSKKDCSGHVKYGVWEESNMPVIFTNHKYEIAYYHTFVIKVNLPFSIADKGNQLMDGLQWYSSSPNDGQIGLNNSCMIDGFLMDFKIRALDISHCVGCLFMHKTGSGRMIERILRTIIHYIIMVADPKMDKGGVCQVIRKFTYEQQLFVKRIWIDRLLSPDELQQELSIDWHGQPHYVNDLLRDPFNGRHMMTRMSMYRLVLGNLGPITAFDILVVCGCGNRVFNKIQCNRFMAVDTESGRYVTPEPAFLTFNVKTLEFDGNYWETGENENVNTTYSRLNTSRKINGKDCPSCSGKFKINGISVPETTWMIITEVPTFMRHSLDFEELPISFVYGSDCFEIAWVCFMVRGNHFVSAHLMNGHWYYYDDLAGGRAGRDCPLTRIEAGNFDFSQHEMQRVFYRRVTEASPHRCIKHACDEEIDKLMK